MHARPLTGRSFMRTTASFWPGVGTVCGCTCKHSMLGEAFLQLHTYMASAVLEQVHAFFMASCSAQKRARQGFDAPPGQTSLLYPKKSTGCVMERSHACLTTP